MVKSRVAAAAPEAALPEHWVARVNAHPRGRRIWDQLRGKFSLPFIDLVAGCVRWQREPHRSQEKLVAANTTLLPPSWLPALDFAGCAEIAGLTHSSDFYPDGLDPGWDAHSPDEVWLAYFPARTRKDLAIRRTRMPDAIWLSEHCSTDWRRILNWLAIASWDYIAVCNVLLAECFMSAVLGHSWFDSLAKFGVWSLSAPDWAEAVKTLSNVIKSRECTGFNVFCYLELSCLTGYRNPPWPGFDQEAEVKKLCSGGDPQPAFVRESYATYASEALFMAPRPPRAFIGFREYVTSGQWATTGSSSDGRVLWVDKSGRVKKVKARKNLAVGILDLRLLADKALSTRVERSKSIVKAELGKVRIAVAGSLESYLIMSYVMFLVNGAYLQWAGSTMEESPQAQLERMYTMWQLVLLGYGMPFDYASFDHQIEIADQVDIAAILLRCAEVGVPANDPDWPEVVAAWKAMIEDVTVDGVQMESGLSSGVRTTTVMGNGHSSVKRATALDVAQLLGVPPDRIEAWVRGDDSAIFSSCWAYLMAMKMGLDVADAKSSAGKFSIRRSFMEFLRVWFDSSGAHGYSARALPGLVQRKPWSNSPWDETGSWRAIFETLSTLRRRQPECTSVAQAFWSRCCAVWSIRTGLPVKLLSIPEPLGGYGVGEWDLVSYATEPAPRVPATSVRVTNSTGFIGRTIADRVTSSTGVDCTRLAPVWDTRELSRRMLACDLPEIGAELRSEFKARVKRWSGAVHRFAHADLRAAAPPLLNAVSDLAATPVSYSTLMQQQSKMPMFGVYRRFVPYWRDCQLAKEAGANALDLMTKRHPYFKQDLSTIEHRGLHRAEALDWLFGTIWAPPSRESHPAARSLLTLLAARSATPTSRRWARHAWYAAVATTFYAYEHAFVRSPLGVTLFGW